MYNKTDIIMHKSKQDEDLLSDTDKPTYLDILVQQLGQSEMLILNQNKFGSEANKRALNRIKIMQTKREDKIHLAYGDDPIQLFKSQWKYLSQLFPQTKKQVKALANARIKNVYKDIREDKLKIQEKQPLLPKFSYQTDLKIEQIESLKGHSDTIKKKLLEINDTLDNIEHTDSNGTNSKNIFSDLYTEQKRKQYEQYMKKRNEQREERRKKLEQQKQKQIKQQQKQQQEKLKKQEEELKVRKQQFLKKQMQLHQMRTEEKKTRELRNSEYIRIRKQLKEKPPLHNKLMKSFQQRRDYEELEKRHKIMSERRQRYRHIDEMKIEEHQKSYETQLNIRQRDRLQRMQQILKQRKSGVRYHHSMEALKQTDKQALEKQFAKQKYKKTKEYQDIVKQNFMPKINEEKRKEMLTLIQELDLNSRRLKKTKLQNGAIVYEEIKESNPRQIGIKYLEKTKQMAARARISRSQQTKEIVQTPQKTKTVDYLAQWRKNPRANDKDKISVILGHKSNLSFDQKLDKILFEAQKLNSITKKNEMKLKYGKFGTSDEILTCTEEIDQNYLDIAKMKLKLIKEDK